ncbi:MAG: 4a-hydroxytetrahydrobiopterin dehydratase [Candidatus Magasanikbacteria bacterium CG11_big_fil_rev_8_21_14_0_20_43_7]|uniref:Putative pterin-4-alpha-carbinolamine dehydratase n=1 Tax=Candidatus Magasanikbacteria bacterium CG11_big_fil_rev_8_21_14_0_20_43_7 TaxID=1974654 RepID=A0A2H0N225_9BACT|nr:MAG: 4a-hydroxytetrahydrobiopterin dehydratase [Candidatus Magasanikbacteria bacterium CG11_big_fil_rev_8_21_14_0_20_43_7]
MSDLTQKHCVPCEGGTPRFTSAQIAQYMEKLGDGWTSVDDARIQKTFQYTNFVEALAFVNHVGTIAEAEQHHPDIHIHYNKVVIELWTHAIEGLSENDFIVAAKIDQIS